MFIRKNLSIISFHINNVHIIHLQITISKRIQKKSEPLFSFENMYSNDSRRFSLYYIYTTIMIAWLFVYYKDKHLLVHVIQFIYISQIVLEYLKPTKFFTQKMIFFFIFAFPWSEIVWMKNEIHILAVCYVIKYFFIILFCKLKPQNLIPKSKICNI